MSCGQKRLSEESCASNLEPVYKVPKPNPLLFPFTKNILSGPFRTSDWYRYEQILQAWYDLWTRPVYDLENPDDQVTNHDLEQIRVYRCLNCRETHPATDLSHLNITGVHKQTCLHCLKLTEHEFQIISRADLNWKWADRLEMILKDDKENIREFDIDSYRPVFASKGKGRLKAPWSPEEFSCQYTSKTHLSLGKTVTVYTLKFTADPYKKFRSAVQALHRAPGKSWKEKFDNFRKAKNSSVPQSGPFSSGPLSDNDLSILLSGEGAMDLDLQSVPTSQLANEFLEQITPNERDPAREFGWMDDCDWSSNFNKCVDHTIQATRALLNDGRCSGNTPAFRRLLDKLYGVLEVIESINLPAFAKCSLEKNLTKISQLKNIIRQKSVLNAFLKSSERVVNRVFEGW